MTSIISPDSLVEDLRKLVISMAAGARLPTVRQLMSDYQVSQHFVQSALAQLRSEGVIASHVGRGTFVTPGPAQAASTKGRTVLTLVHDSPYERSDAIASLLHRALMERGCDSMVLTYSQSSQVMDMLRGGRRFDACIVQPRTSTLRSSMLAQLRDLSEVVIIEGQAADGLDVDAISNDPGTCVELALRHLIPLEHERIAWVSEQNNQNFFKLCVRAFDLARNLLAQDAASMPSVYLPPNLAERKVEALVDALRPLFAGGRTKSPTAVVISSFLDGGTVLKAFDRLGLSVPADVSVIKVGTPDMESDHVGRLAIVGRPTYQVTDAVLARLEWRWARQGQPCQTIFDQPILQPFSSTAAVTSGPGRRRPSG